MNFNNTWRNYVNKPTKSKGQLLGEQIFREYKLLAEGKKDDAKKIAPITAHFGTVDLIANQLRTMLGDKGVGKYIVFAAREMEPVYQNNYVPYTKEDGTTGYTDRPNREFRYMTGHLEQIMTAIREFHASQNRLEQRDINKYKALMKIL